MPTLDEADKKARLERARETGLFRYSLVQELAEPGLTALERGRRARELAGRVHDGPGGQPVTVSRGTLDRWRRAYEAGGFDALVPSPRQPSPRTPPEVLALAEALKREKPGRTAAQVQRILRVTSGWAPSDRTLQRLFERLELNAPAPGPGEEDRALSRFECARPNEMWTGDTLCRRRHNVSYADPAVMPTTAAECRVRKGTGRMAAA
jgi:putative transposase